MKGNGNSWSVLLKKLFFMMIPTSGGRTRFIVEHSNEFKHIGGGVFFKPRMYPADPELISIGDNVKIASDVQFVNHDIIAHMLNAKFDTRSFNNFEGCIFIGDNVMIGTGTIILPNVKIGSNVIIGAGSIVSKDIPDNCVAAGVPCRKIGEFETMVEKYRRVEKHTCEDLWRAFEEMHNLK